MEDKISVVIPVYQAEETLEQAVASFFAQSWANKELILVDDGCTDRSGSICDRLKRENSGVTVIHRGNGGVSAARNCGMEYATGEYLAFMDSDDLLEPDYLENLHAAAKAYPHCLPVCGIRLWQEQGEETVHAGTPSLIKTANFPLIYRDGLLAGPCNKLFETKLLQKAQLRFDHRFSIGEDMLFNLEYLRHKEGIYLTGKAAYIYRIKDTDGLHAVCGYERFQSIAAMYRKSRELLDFCGAEREMYDIVDELILNEYSYSLERYCNGGGKASGLKKVLKSQEYRQALTALKRAKIQPKLKLLMKRKSAGLISLYFMLGRRKRHEG